MEGVRRIAVGLLDHPEGVAVDRDGTIWCGGEEGQVYTCRIDTEPREVARLGGHVLGIALDGDGQAYCVSHGPQPGLYRVDRAGATEVVCEGTPARPSCNPNHPLVLGDGTVLLTESGDFGEQNGCTYAVAPDGVTSIADSSCAGYPNGLAPHPSGEEVWIVESAPPRIAALTLGPGGTLGDHRVVCELDGYVPDGIAFDALGRALVSCWTPDAILIIEDGSPRELLRDPLRQYLISPTNIAFVPDTKTVVVANIGNRFLSVFEHDAVGARLPRPSRVLA